MSGAKYVITSAENLATVRLAIETIEEPVEIVLFTDVLSDVPSTISESNVGNVIIRSLHTCLEPFDPGRLASRLREIKNTSVAAVMATSGTSGTPKMAERTHQSLICETEAIEDNDAAKPYECRHLFCTPIYHAFTLPDMAINALRLGHASYFLKHFDHSFLDKVWAFNITETMAVPSMLQAIVKHASMDSERHKIQSLRKVLCAGAPLSPQLATQLRSLFSRPPRVVQAWGIIHCIHFGSLQYPNAEKQG